jgi:hypothetical protein
MGWFPFLHFHRKYDHDLLCVKELKKDNFLDFFIHLRSYTFVLMLFSSYDRIRRVGLSWRHQGGHRGVRLNAVDKVSVLCGIRE